MRLPPKTTEEFGGAVGVQLLRHLRGLDADVLGRHRTGNAPFIVRRPDASLLEGHGAVITIEAVDGSPRECPPVLVANPTARSALGLELFRTVRGLQDCQGVHARGARAGYS